MMNYNYEYVISSMRNRASEQNINFYSNEFYGVGDCFEMDGISWHVNEVVSRNVDNDEDSLLSTIVDECGYRVDRAKSIIAKMKADGVELISDNVWSYLVNN